MRFALIATALAAIVLAGCGDDNKSSSKTPAASASAVASVKPAPSAAANPTAAGTAQQSDGNAPGIPVLTGPIQTTASGLQYIDEKVGDGASPKATDRVTVNYTGWLTDGKKFDSSVDRGQPFVFTIGRGQVIGGWDQGVATMKVGDKVRLTIPPELGYGARGAGGVIPPNATLIFEVELLGVGT